MEKYKQNLITILEAMEDGAYIIKPDYTLTFMNKAMANVFGEGAGKKCYQVINQQNKRRRVWQSKD